jgi:hypothetical protein
MNLEKKIIYMKNRSAARAYRRHTKLSMRNIAKLLQIPHTTAVDMIKGRDPKWYVEMVKNSEAPDEYDLSKNV